MSRRNIARVMPSQYKNYLRDDDPFYVAIMDETNMAKWHVMICNLESPWEQGEFYFELAAPDNFPTHPPALACLTANGLYGLGGKICVSIGEFHKDEWRKSLGMPGFIRIGVVNGMICFQAMEDSGGIRISKVTGRVKARRALGSRAYNRQKNAGLFRRFEAFIADHPQMKAVKRLKLTRAGIPAEDAGKLEEMGIDPAHAAMLIASGAQPTQILERLSAGDAPERNAPPASEAPCEAKIETGKSVPVPVPVSVPVADAAGIEGQRSPAAPLSVVVTAEAATPVAAGATEAEMDSLIAELLALDD